MKKFFVFLSAAFLAGTAIAADPVPRTITTLDGQTFKDVIVEGSDAGGIDIGFVNENGGYTIKGISFKNLPEPIRKEFGYDPEKAGAFESRVQKFANADLQKVAETEKDRLTRIKKELKARAEGDKVDVTSEDIAFAVYSGRRAVDLKTIAITKAGTVAEVVKLHSGPAIDSKYVLIDGEDLPEPGQWSAFIYPTGLHGDYREHKKIPVFCDSQDAAATLLSSYLNVYSEYAASNTQTPAAAAPDLAADTTTPATTTNATTATGTADSATDNGLVVYSDRSSSGWGYYLGPSYYPINWYYGRYPNPRPPRPRPPHPPQPGPGPSPRPNPNPRPNPMPRPSPNPRPNPMPGPTPRPTPTPAPTPAPRPTPTVRVPVGDMEIRTQGHFRQAVPVAPHGGFRR